MGKDLKAENLAISLPNHGCNKNCPYCVSRMTGYIDNNYYLMNSNAEKVKTVARAAEITSVLFTGKGEPLLCPELSTIASHFKDFPLELQTNGILLEENLDLLEHLEFSVIAISVDDVSNLHSYEKVVKGIIERGMVPRMTVNIVGEVGKASPESIICVLADIGVRQLTFRRIVAPENPKHKKTAEWIDENSPLSVYNDFIKNLHSAMMIYGAKLIRTLNSGMQIWDVAGIAILISDYCIQEKSNGDDVRSLVFLEDGHLYTSWNSKASILF